MPRVSDGTKVYSRAEIAEFSAAAPLAQPYFDLLRKYVVENGGLVRDVWEALLGPVFGNTTVRNRDAAAEYLGISVATATAVIDETWAAIRPIWEASPEYATWAAAKREEAAARSATADES
jgi:hypothetical protein